jgi:folylpolyglutamate synthase/dihydropteroate synthase
MCEVLERFSCPVVVCLLGERQRADAADKIMHRLGDRARLEDDFSALISGLEKTNAKTLVCGSLYLLGRIYSSFPHWLESGENI